MPRYKLTIEFNGSEFSGWQIQPDTKTVEEEIEKAFSQVLQQPIDLIGQGRTDAGVHAKGQVAHVDLPEGIDTQKLIFGVNGMVGNQIQIHSIEGVGPEFHARFDATSREYEYTVLTKASPLNNSLAWFPAKELDIEKLKACANILIGEHDFNTFSKFNEENYTTLCTIFVSEWQEREGRLVFRISANRFLRNMVRRLVGTMIEVASGRMTISDFENLLNNIDSKKPSVTAPAKGLVLTKVFYEKN